MKYILITGGLGYIGSHLAVHLLNKKMNVIILDNLSNSIITQRENIRTLCFLLFKSKRLTLAVSFIFCLQSILSRGKQYLGTLHALTSVHCKARINVEFLLVFCFLFLNHSKACPRIYLYLLLNLVTIISNSL